jgi:5-methylcytosine-specific restriction protein A
MPQRPKRLKPPGGNAPRYTPPQAARPTAAQRGYDYSWQKARLGYLADHPLCVPCGERGLTMAATVVDHIVPHKGDKTLFWSSDNWQSLCATCHNRKTATSDGGFGR